MVFICGLILFNHVLGDQTDVPLSTTVDNKDKDGAALTGQAQHLAAQPGYTDVQ